MAFDPVWEQIFRSQAWGKYPAEELIRFVARSFYSAADRTAIRLLEVGCGPGANLWYLAREGFRFAGIDGSPTAIAQAEQRLDAECPGWRARGELHVGDIAELPFADETFDAVIDSEALCCNPWEDCCLIYAEMARVVKPGGWLYSRTFATGTWGEGTGEAAGRHAWFCAEGPLAGKGFARFTALEDIPVMTKGFELRELELLCRSLNGQQHEVREWIIQAEKLAMQQVEPS